MECNNSKDQISNPSSFYYELVGLDTGAKREQLLTLIITLRSIFKHNFVKGNEYTDL